MPASPVALALDIATTTGFCFGPVGAQPPLLQWGSRDFGGTVRVGGEMVLKSNGEIQGCFRAWVAQICFVHKPRLVNVEAPYVPVGSKPGGGPPMNPNTLRRLLGMVSAVEAICWELRIPYRETVSAAFTKFLTGKGQYKTRPEKKAAVIQACRFFGCEPQDDNAADALALFFYAESILSPRAAEHRRRLATDRDRELNGSGPLFTVPEKENAPQAAILRGVDATPVERQKPWDRFAKVM